MRAVCIVALLLGLPAVVRGTSWNDLLKEAEVPSAFDQQYNFLNGDLLQLVRYLGKVVNADGNKGLRKSIAGEITRDVGV